MYFILKLLRACAVVLMGIVVPNVKQCMSLVWRGASGTRSNPNPLFGRFHRKKRKRSGGRGCTYEGVLRQEGVWPEQSEGGRL